MDHPTIANVYPAIAMATMAMSAWFVVAYKLNKRATPYSSEFLPTLWYCLPCYPVAAYAYFNGFDAPISTPTGFFIAAIAGVGFGILLLFAVYQSLFAKDVDRAAKRMYFGVATAFVAAFVVGIVI